MFTVRHCNNDNDAYASGLWQVDSRIRPSILNMYIEAHTFRVSLWSMVIIPESRVRRKTVHTCYTRPENTA